MNILTNTPNSNPNFSTPERPTAGATAGTVASIEPRAQLDAPELLARLDAVSIGSDVFGFLELVRDLATAPDCDRRDVAAWCAAELEALDAQAERPSDGVD